MKKKYRFILFSIALLFLLSLLLPGSPVLAIPAAPHQFYGNVVIDGGVAPAGTIVSATIAGADYPNSTTKVTVFGRYGYQPSLKLPSDDRQTPRKEGGVNGDLVEFYVKGHLAGQAKFKVFGLTNLQLRVTTAKVVIDKPIVTYSLTLNNNGGGFVTNPGEGIFTYAEGSMVDIEASPKTGLEKFGFTHWSGDTNTVANVYSAITKVKMTHDITLTANFATTLRPKAVEPDEKKVTDTPKFKIIAILAIPEGVSTEEALASFREYYKLNVEGLWVIVE